MVKPSRPVLVVSPNLKGRTGLVTVVALSTVKPNPIMPFNYQIPRQSMPQLGRFQENDSWVKGDMFYSVGFHRLELIKLGKKDLMTGKRQYYTRRLGRTQMRAIYQCVLHGLGMGKVAQYV